MTEKQLIFHIDVLSLIHSKHMQHGLRMNDYLRYRRYCSVKISRLRKWMKKQKKSKPVYQKTALNPELVNESRLLTIPLFCAERCWARSLEVKGYSEQNPKRRHYWMKKLKRSCNFAQQFHTLVENTKCDISTKWEAKAYYYWLLSTYYLSLKQWQNALNYILQSKNAYEAIIKVIKSESVPIYENRINELSVSEKYCTYSLRGFKNPQELSTIYASIKNEEFSQQISDFLSEARQSGVNSVEIEWQSHKYHVYTEKAKEFLINFRDKDTQLLQSKQFDSRLEIFDKYLLECKEAIQQFVDLMKGNSKFKYIDDCCNNSNYVQNVQNYLGSLKIVLSTQRNTLILNDLMKRYGFNNDSFDDICYMPTKKTDVIKAEHFIRILDQLIQNITDSIELDACVSDTAKRDNEAAINIYKGCRTFFGSLLMRDDGRLQQAVVLLYQSLLYFESAKSIQNIHSSINNILDFFEDKSRSLKIEMDILLLSNQTSENKNSDNKTIFQRCGETEIDENRINVDLITIPTTYIPIPCHPVVKDNVIQSFTWPDIPITSKTSDISIIKQQQTKPGFASYVKSWIWG